MTTPARRRLRGLTGTVTTATVAALVVAVGPAGTGSPVTDAPVSPSAYAPASVGSAVAAGRRWPGHPGRRLVSYRVHRGDTATGLAVRFHAWTRELRSLNHLDRSGRLRVGQRLLIPVVTAAVSRHHAKHHAKKHARHHAKKHHTKQHTKHHTKKQHAKPWRHAGASRAQVRRVVVRKARHHRVDPQLALAIAWQESGWQQRRTSSAGAIGVMQVLPGTARWMSGYVDRRLNPYGLRDNVTAGVVLLRVLRGQTTYKRSIAAYYQGLGSVQRRGLYPSTRAYTRNVMALRHRLEHGWNPL